MVLLSSKEIIKLLNKYNFKIEGKILEKEVKVETGMRSLIKGVFIKRQ